MRISEKFVHLNTEHVGFSLEFSPAKTTQGMQNLYDRIERMAAYGPAFIDITWGAGGSHSNLTTEMVATAQADFGLDTMMHLICTGMEQGKFEAALQESYNAGCQNILALRGDPPRDKEKWEATDGGFKYAVDLVRYIRKKYGDYFDICVAGYPEGHPECSTASESIQHLKDKVDAGANFIITQMFYDVDNYIDWVQKCRAAGISCPIIPGIMPIQSWDAFLRRAKWMNATIPKHFLDELEPVKDDDAQVRERGTKLMVQMCQRLIETGTVHLHFYTMNLEKATKMILEGLGLLQQGDTCTNKPPLPWQRSLTLKRSKEDVRPIFWKNRQKSYIARTQEWDEFPNGRWGDSKSPAFGDHHGYGLGLRVKHEQVYELWGHPSSYTDVSNIFVKYLKGELQCLPWSETPMSSEGGYIRDQLIRVNEMGYLTINSQPAVASVKSSHPDFGWGPPNGYVYQKAYLEMFVHPDLLDSLLSNAERDPLVGYYAVGKSGELRTNMPKEGATAVTWGVFPCREIVQPTIVEANSFLAWRDEAYQLGNDWSKSYRSTSASRKLLDELVKSWVLCVIVHNDYHDKDAIFRIFDGLKAVSDLRQQASDH
ncbi:methylenetetrahydrofolate reductase [Acrasis kona]|uniref:methylenetetrahydrofolate reductase (NADH) n=1 Tax=Acrasis kona TaxID=1008807 RepID=A0AAW2YKL9_9EUKA